MVIWEWLLCFEETHLIYQVLYNDKFSLQTLYLIEMVTW